MTAGVSLTRQHPADVVARVRTDQPVTDIHRDLVDDERMQEAIVRAVRDVLDGVTAAEAIDTLEAAGVDALHGSYAALAKRTAEGDRRAVFDLLRTTRRLGHGRSTVDDVIGGVPPLLELAETVTPTVAVDLSESFWSLDRAQREAVVALLTALGRGCDVRIVGGRIDHRRLLAEHGNALPVSADAITPVQATPIDEAIADAADAIDHDSREARVLDELGGRTPARSGTRRCMRPSPTSQSPAFGRWCVTSPRSASLRRTPIPSHPRPRASL